MAYDDGCKIGTPRPYGDRSNDGKHRFTRTHTSAKIESDKNGRYKKITDTCKLCGEEHHNKLYLGFFPI